GVGFEIRRTGPKTGSTHSSPTRWVLISTPPFPLASLDPRATNPARSRRNGQGGARYHGRPRARRHDPGAAEPGCGIGPPGRESDGADRCRPDRRGERARGLLQPSAARAHQAVPEPNNTRLAWLLVHGTRCQLVIGYAPGERR